MAERVSINEEITSGDAGLMATRLEARRLDSCCCGLAGNDLRFLSLAGDGVDEVLTDVRSGIEGPCTRSGCPIPAGHKQ